MGHQVAEGAAANSAPRDRQPYGGLPEVQCGYLALPGTSLTGTPFWPGCGSGARTLRRRCRAQWSFCAARAGGTVESLACSRDPYTGPRPGRHPTFCGGSHRTPASSPPSRGRPAQETRRGGGRGIAGQGVTGRVPGPQRARLLAGPAGRPLRIAAPRRRRRACARYGPGAGRAARRRLPAGRCGAACVTDRSTTRAISGSDRPGWAQASRKLVIATLARRTAGSPLPRVSPMSQRGWPLSETISSRSPPTRVSAAAET